jgi:hypothetical protein
MSILGDSDDRVCCMQLVTGSKPACCEFPSLRMASEWRQLGARTEMGKAPGASMKLGETGDGNLYFFFKSLTRENPCCCKL